MSRSVEATGSSVDEAVASALTQLGVRPEAARVEVLAEARRGLFGNSKPAHVRVTTDDEPSAPVDTAVRDQEESVTDTGTPMTGLDEPPDHPAEAIEEEQDSEEELPQEQQVDQLDEEDGEEELSQEQRMDQLDEEADLAADFVEGLLDMLDLPGDIEIEVHEQQALVNIQEVGSGLLIGRRGATLDALQELVRGAVQRQTERRSHVRVDVESYRARKLDKLRDKCRDSIAEVRETGEPVRLEPMDAFERKMMHDLVAKASGVTSSSEGSEPKRRVVICPES